MSSETGNSEIKDEWDSTYEEDVTISCLFCEELFKKSTDVFVHCQDKHSFDFFGLKTTLNLDFYRCIRLINFIRTQHRAGIPSDKIIAASKDAKKEFWTNDTYLKPVLEDDPLLFGLDIEELDSKNEEKDLKRENEELKNKMEDLQQTLAKTIETLKNINFHDDEPELALKKPAKQNVERQQKRREKQEWRKVDEKTKSEKPKQKNEREWLKVDHDEGYFEGYGPRYIHELMLRDKVRTCAYRDFFL